MSEAFPPPAGHHGSVPLWSAPTEAAWLNEVPIALTVCDRDGKILSLNEAACRVFATDGGVELISRNVLDCHPGERRGAWAETNAELPLRLLAISRERVVE